MKSWWVALTVTVVVLLIAAGGYVGTRPGEPSAEPPIASTAPAESPPSAPMPTRPTAGPTLPTALPTPSFDTPVPAIKTPHVRPPEPPRGSLAVPVRGYEVLQRPDRLRLHYVIGVPECYGVVDAEDGVTVTETADAVRVLLQRTPAPAPPEDQPCPRSGRSESVTVDLQEPLGTRTVVDAGVNLRVRERTSSPAAPSTAPGQ